MNNNSFNKYLSVIFFIIIFFSCKKEEKNYDNSDKEYYELISSEKVASYTASQIKSIINTAAPDIIGEIDFLYDVEIYLVQYRTPNPHGKFVIASGVVLLPLGSGEEFPILSFQHGTVLKKLDAPSTVSFGKESGLLFATQGFITCLPDFLGLGSGEGIHPYLHSETEASATIDLIRASKEICGDCGIIPSEQLFLLGYSQGGHATMATHKMIEERYSNEFTVTASAPMAGPYDISGIMYDLTIKKAPYNEPAYVPYVLYSYDFAYNIYQDITKNFISPFDTILPLYFDENQKYSLSELSSILPDSKIPTGILTGEAYLELSDKTGKFYSAMQKNDLYDWKPLAPVYLFHCDCDSTVPNENSEKAYNFFKKNGVFDVELINPLPGGNHNTCALPSIIQAMNRFKTLKL